MAALVLLAALAVLPMRASAQVTIDRIKASANQVGVVPRAGQEGASQVRFQALLLGGAADLLASTVTITKLLGSDAGELVKGTGGGEVLPVTLFPRSDAKPERTVYEPVGGGSTRPSFWVRLRQRPGKLQVRIRVDRATIPVHPCPTADTTSLATAFRIDPAGGVPIAVSIVQQWRCSADQLRRQADLGGSVSGGGEPPPPPSPGQNQPPTASLRVEQITRDTGEPNLVELDGTASQDPDGRVVRYLFESGDGRTQDGANPVVTFVYPPGDYRAGLTVFDDQGAASALVTRGFSVH